MKIFVRWGIIFCAGLIVGLLISRTTKLAPGQVLSKIETATKSSPRSQFGSAPMSKHGSQTEPFIDLFEQMAPDGFERLANNALLSDDKVQSQALLTLLISEWSNKDPMGALAFAAQQELSSLIYLPLLALGESIPEQALAWLDNYTDDEVLRARLARHVYEGMALVDPEKAIHAVELLPEGRGKDDALVVVLEKWAQQDMTSAFDWLETAPFTTPVRHVYTSLMYQYMDKDPVAAAHVVQQMHTCDLKSEFAARAATEYASKNLSGALQWAEGLDAESKRLAMTGVIDVWASGSDASGALAYVVEIQSDSNKAQLLDVVASSLAYAAPDLLMDSMENMQESEQLIVAKRMAIAMSGADLKRCDDWLQELPQGTLRDTVLEEVLDDYRNSNPSRAFSLSETITQDQNRQQAMERMLSEWILIDQAAAEQALNQSSALSSLQKQEVLGRIYKNLPQNDYLLP